MGSISEALVANGEENQDAQEEAISGTVWSKAGTSYRAADDVMSILPSGKYQASSSMFGGVFLSEVSSTVREATYFLEGGVYSQVGAEVSKFVSSAQKYRDNGIQHRRGILLYGPPGCGKSCILEGIQEYVVEQGGVVVHPGDMSETLGVLRMIAAVEPDRLVVIPIDEMDSLAENVNTEKLLGMLDGSLIPSSLSVFILCTTNYLDRLQDRFYRPGRMDLVIEVESPTVETRKSYLTHLTVVPPEDIARLSEITEGLSLADIKEVVVSSYILGLCTAEERVAYVQKLLYNRGEAGSEAEDGDWGGPL
jgi:SpoVK/Ycf46/Vps4 family AAA+-type ATPase